MQRKPRILYLMENIIDLGIANSIKEKFDCEIFALVDTNKFIQKLFEEQKIVNFEKKWYFRDHVKELKNEVDVEYLKKIEEKYKINLWMIAYSERIFYRYNQYYQFSKDEILSIFEKECKLFERILDEIEPEYVIIKIPDYNQSQLLYEICKARKIKILMLNHSRLGYRYIISETPNNIDELDLNRKSKMKKNLTELEEYVQNYSRQISRAKDNYGTSSYLKFKASLRYIFKVCNNEYRKYFVNFGRNRSKILRYESSIVLKRKFRGWFLMKNSLKEITTEKPFVFYAMHFQPERSTLLDTPFYVDQIKIIESIARSLPVDYTLYVKEHPIQARNGWRKISEYKEILKMPNVKLINPYANTKNIIKKCSLVSTLSGTIALEAAFLDKPAITFSDIIYSNISSIFRVKSLEKLPEIIQKAISTKVDVEELNSFTEQVLENSFEYDDIDLAIQLQHKFFYGGFLYDVEISVKKFELFIQEYKKTLDNLAIQYIRKIKSSQTEENNI